MAGAEAVFALQHNERLPRPAAGKPCSFSVTIKVNETFKLSCEITPGYYGVPGEAVMYPRRFARVRPTGRVSDVGKLIVDPKKPVIDCRVVDYSPGGACLELPAQTKVPNRFELLFGPARKRCRVVWTAGRRIGVAF